MIWIWFLLIKTKTNNLYLTKASIHTIIGVYHIQCRVLIICLISSTFTHGKLKRENLGDYVIKCQSITKANHLGLTNQKQLFSFTSLTFGEHYFVCSFHKKPRVSCYLKVTLHPKLSYAPCFTSMENGGRVCLTFNMKSCNFYEVSVFNESSSFMTETSFMTQTSFMTTTYYYACYDFPE